VGKDIRAASELAAQFRWIKGNPFAKAGIESAWWDLHARQAGEPLCTQLGGQATSVSVGADFGIADTLDDLLGDVGKAVAAQFPRVKLKIKPGWDVEVVRAVRREFPTLIMHVDGNSGYRLEDREIFEALDELSLEMIEQPLAHDDLLDHAQLQRGLRTPICLDESITSLRRAQQAVESGACRYINIKPPRVGGLSNAIAIHDFCQATATPCWVGSMLESAVGAAHCLAFATLPGFTYAADILTSDFLYGQEDLGVPATTLSQPGTMTPSSSPGIGVRPHPQKLAARTLTIASFAV
jgi:O-succinylbenzoate synthase